MNVRFLLNRIRRKLHSRIKVREVLRKANWLEFENENILNFLAKYNVFVDNHEASPGRHLEVKTQDYDNNEPRFVIDVLETSNS